MEAVLKIEKLAKYFGTTKVLKDISLDVYKGDVIAIIGPSGSGKSTFLRCINLLETPTRGKLSFHYNPYFNIDYCKDDFVDYEAYRKSVEDYGHFARVHSSFPREGAEGYQYHQARRPVQRESGEYKLPALLVAAPFQQRGNRDESRRQRLDRLSYHPQPE